MRRLAIVVLAAVASLACNPIVAIDPIVVHADGRTPESFDRLVSAARGAGYEPAILQPDRFRFGVEARYRERRNVYRIAIESYADGSLRVRPIGARVELYRGQYYLPGRFRDEIAALTAALARAARR